MSDPAENLTQLLIEASRGDNFAFDEILPLVYHELRKIAQNYLNRERGDPRFMRPRSFTRLICA